MFLEVIPLYLVIADSSILLFAYSSVVSKEGSALCWLLLAVFVFAIGALQYIDAASVVSLRARLIFIYIAPYLLAA